MLHFQRRAIQPGQQAVERFNLVDDEVADASTRRAGGTGGAADACQHATSD